MSSQQYLAGFIFGFKFLYLEISPSMVNGLLGGLVLVIVSIAIAWPSLKLYDEPVGNWLKKRFLMKRAG